MSPSETELPRRGLPAGQHEATSGVRATLDGKWQSVEHLGPSVESSEPIEKRIPIDNSSEIDDQVHLDLSSLEAPAATPTLREKEGDKAFHPKLDWKPITMRWQYLSLLVIISLSLAILQELLYRHSDRHNGLLTFGSVSDLSTGQYFLWRYAPTLGLVIFGMMVEATDFEMKKLQPYYLMAREEGASAEESVLIEPLSLWTYFTNPRLIGLRIFASESMTLLATLAVPTLQNASLGITQDEQLKQHVIVNNVWSRLVTSTLCVLAAFIIIVLICNARNRSGLPVTPRGIVGIAKMGCKSHILSLAKDLDTASPSDIRAIFEKQRYFLKNSNLYSEPISHQQRRTKRKSHYPHPSMLRTRSLLGLEGFLILVILLFTITIFTKANRALQKIPLLTAQAVGIKLFWTMLDDAVRLMEPFHALSRRHASYRILFLDYTGTSSLVVLFKSLINNHPLLFLVSFNSILVEVLIVCLSSFKAPASNFRHRSDVKIIAAAGDEESFASFWISFILSLFILLSLIVTTGLVCRNRRHPVMAQVPGTIAASLVVINQSKFLFDMVETEEMNVTHMEERLSKTGKTFGYGWFTGRDGETHCGVDEEALRADYRFGRSLRGGREPWMQDWSLY